MLTTPRFELDPVSPQAGDHGPLIIRDADVPSIRPPICIIPGSMRHQTRDGILVALLDEDDITVARLIVAAPRMRKALEVLLQWSRHMGGWEAPCWEEAQTVLTSIYGHKSGEPPEDNARQPA